MPFTAQLLQINVDKTSRTSITLDKQFDWAIECKFDAVINPITAIRINGNSGGDTWQIPFNGNNWIIAPYKVDDKTLRLYFSKNQPQTKFLISIQYNDSSMDYGYALSPNDTIAGLPPKQLYLYQNLPKEVEDARKKMVWDERGLICGVRVGNYWVHGSKHVLDLQGYWGNPTEENIRYFGDYVVYQCLKDVGSDNVCYELPPIGTKIWQINPKGVVRTSRIANYPQTVSLTTELLGTYAVLRADGPFPGVPIGGDSGSVCFYFDEKDQTVKILGICGYGGTCFVATPTQWPVEWTDNINKRPILKYVGSANQPMSVNPVVVLDNDWYAKMTQNSTILNIPLENDSVLQPVLSPVSPPTDNSVLRAEIIKNTQDFVGVGNSLSPNGKADNCIRIFNLSKPYKTIRINGANGDTWETPYNPTGYWDIKVVTEGVYTFLLYFEPSNPSNSFTISVMYSDGSTASCVATPALEAALTPPPSASGTSGSSSTSGANNPATTPTPSDLDKYKKAIADIKAIINNLI